MERFLLTNHFDILPLFPSTEIALCWTATFLYNRRRLLQNENLRSFDQFFDRLAGSESLIKLTNQRKGLYNTLLPHWSKSLRSQSRMWERIELQLVAYSNRHEWWSFSTKRCPPKVCFNMANLNEKDEDDLNSSNGRGKCTSSYVQGRHFNECLESN